MGPTYLIRYGLARSLGRFESRSGTFDSGRTVVIQSHRGTELGVILSEISPPTNSGLATILRPATPDDLARAEEVASHRMEYFESCRAAFEVGEWPLELIDCEPLLDNLTTVVHYLGPHGFEVSGLVAALRERCGLQIVLEPVGRDIPDASLDPPSNEVAQGCGNCGNATGGSCGSGGGCDASEGCAVKSLVASRRQAVVRA